MMMWCIARGAASMSGETKLILWMTLVCVETAMKNI